MRRHDNTSRRNDAKRHRCTAGRPGFHPNPPPLSIRCTDAPPLRTSAHGHYYNGAAAGSLNMPPRSHIRAPSHGSRSTQWHTFEPLPPPIKPPRTRLTPRLSALTAYTTTSRVAPTPHVVGTSPVIAVAPAPAATRLHAIAAPPLAIAAIATATMSSVPLLPPRRALPPRVHPLSPTPSP